MHGIVASEGKNDYLNERKQETNSSENMKEVEQDNDVFEISLNLI